MTAYYNENDPGAASWLRELIEEGLIADGYVDERSIADVDPVELVGYTQCHFFAGIGGWSYALRLAGWDDSRPVWTGSCPCQPFSNSGHRRGTDDERHLWPEFYRLIRECRPTTVFGEQVASKLGREWLSGVFADLEAVGYAGAGADLCAAGLGAPHIRQRLYWVADAYGRAGFGGQPQSSKWTIPGGDETYCGMADTIGARRQPVQNEPGGHGARVESEWEGLQPRQPCPDANSNGGLADAESERLNGCPGAAESAGRGFSEASRADGGLEEPKHGGCQGRHTVGPRTGTTLPPGASGGLGEPNRAGRQPGRIAAAPAGYGCAIEPAGGVIGLEYAQGHRERAEKQSGQWHGVVSAGTRRLIGGCGWNDYELIPCLDGKTRRTQPGLFPLADGVSKNLVHLLQESIFESEGALDEYGKASNSNREQAVRMVRGTYESEKIFQWSAGMPFQLPAKAFLLDFLLLIPSARDGAAYSCGRKKKSTQESAKQLRGVRRGGGVHSASHRRESYEQFRGESPDTLRALSLFLACCAAKVWAQANEENAAPVQLKNWPLGRVGLLRGYGNAIVPQVAALFIQAHQEAKELI